MQCPLLYRDRLQRQAFSAIPPLPSKPVLKINFPQKKCLSVTNLELVTRPKYPSYRETSVAIPLSHCVSCGIADSRCYTPTCFLTEDTSRFTHPRNVPAFRFSFRGNIRTYPRSGFSFRGICMNVPSFRFSFRGNIRQNHPFGNCPFGFLRYFWRHYIKQCNKVQAIT